MMAPPERTRRAGSRPTTNVPRKLTRTILADESDVSPASLVYPSLSSRPADRKTLRGAPKRGIPASRGQLLWLRVCGLAPVRVRDLAPMAGKTAATGILDLSCLFRCGANDRPSG